MALRLNGRVLASCPASALITFNTTGRARLVATDRRPASKTALIKRSSALSLYGSTYARFLLRHV
jgi:hypothetical protein